MKGEKMKIIIDDVSKNIKKLPIITNVSLHLESGKIYGLRGKNGAGKTMLLRLICGLVLPTSGKITIDNLELGKDLSFPDSLGILIENPGLITNYSGIKNLMTLASIKDEIDQHTIIDLMNYFDLDPNDNKKVKNYSLGMKQKIGIISAVLENPKIILLDEPLNGLDEESTQKVLDLLTNRKEKGALIIVASHDKEELDFLADEIIEMKTGKVLRQYGVDKNAR